MPDQTGGSTSGSEGQRGRRPGRAPAGELSDTEGAATDDEEEEEGEGEEEEEEGEGEEEGEEEEAMGEDSSEDSSEEEGLSAVRAGPSALPG